MYCMIINNDTSPHTLTHSLLSPSSNDQDDNGISSELNKMNLDDIVEAKDICELRKDFISVSTYTGIKGPCNIAQILNH